MEVRSPGGQRRVFCAELVGKTAKMLMIVKCKVEIKNPIDIQG